MCACRYRYDIDVNIILWRIVTDTIIITVITSIYFCSFFYEKKRISKIDYDRSTWKVLGILEIQLNERNFNRFILCSMELTRGDPKAVKI